VSHEKQGEEDKMTIKFRNYTFYIQLNYRLDSIERCVRELCRKRSVLRRAKEGKQSAKRVKLTEQWKR
jgi:hypothetical protein